MTKLSSLSNSQLLEYQRLYNRLVEQPSYKRLEDCKINGMDTKNAYHIIRLALQGKQILETGDMVLDANAELLKDIRAGKYDLQSIEHMFADAEADLERLHKTSSLRDKADTKSLQKVLLECLEMKYGYLP